MVAFVQTMKNFILRILLLLFVPLSTLNAAPINTDYAQVSKENNANPGFGFKDQYNRYNGYLFGVIYLGIGLVFQRIRKERPYSPICFVLSALYFLANLTDNQSRW